MKDLREKYNKEIIQKLKGDLKKGNTLSVPKLEKIVVNMGLGEDAANTKTLDNSLKELAMITGQKPKTTLAKKSISTFKIRQGAPVGGMVTLRGQRMYDFLSKLINVILPRLRDFKGISKKSFDGRGNYNLGLKEHIVFPEINYDKVDKVKGMDISFVTTAENNEEAKALLENLGMPFRK